MARVLVTPAARPSDGFSARRRRVEGVTGGSRARPTQSHSGPVARDLVADGYGVVGGGAGPLRHGTDRCVHLPAALVGLPSVGLPSVGCPEGLPSDSNASCRTVNLPAPRGASGANASYRAAKPPAPRGSEYGYCVGAGAVRWEAAWRERQWNVDATHRVRCRGDGRRSVRQCDWADAAVQRGCGPPSLLELPISVNELAQRGVNVRPAARRCGFEPASTIVSSGALGGSPTATRLIFACRLPCDASDGRRRVLTIQTGSCRVASALLCPTTGRTPEAAA